MPADPLARVVAAALAAADPTPDPDLLARFAADRDPAAFELLVRRHADLVWRVCRGVLPGDHHAAEDAFQATFLTLARKAGAVRGSAAGWLFRVARNAALKARAKAARHPRPLTADVPSQGAADPGVTAEVSAAVAEEVDRLPARFPDPVVLCLLQGLTQAEAAARLGWPVGTLASRLSRARDRLRGRLERRGVAGAAGAVVGANTLTAGADLIRATVLLGVGGRPVPATVASLTTGVIAAMHTSKIVTVLTVVAVGVAGTGTAWVLAQDKKPGPADPAGGPAPAANAPGGGPATPAPEPYVPDPAATEFPNIKPSLEEDPSLAARLPRVLPTDDPATRVRKRRLLTAYEQYRIAWRMMTSGRASPAELDGPIRDIATAAGELWSAEPAAIRPWLEWRVAAAKQVEAVTAQSVQKGRATTLDVLAAHRDRLDAELALLKLNAR